MRTRALNFEALVLSLGLLTAGCGDDTGAGANGGTGGTGGAGGNGTGAMPNTTTTEVGSGGNNTGGAPPECEGPGNPGTSNDVATGQVTAVARDETDTTITNFDLQLCGTDICLYGKTNVIGQVTFTNNAGPTIDRPMFKPGDSLVVGKIGYPYTGEATSTANPMPGIFPRMVDSGSAIAAGESITVAGVTLDVPAGGVVVIDDLIYDEPAKQTFRAATVPPAKVPDVTGDPSFVMVVSLGPVDTAFCPGANVSFANSANLAPNTEVEFWGQTLSIAEDFGPYGAWVKLGEGSVSADGTTVSTNAAGLPVLLTYAIKPKA